MAHDIQFQVLTLPNSGWEEALRRFQQIEALGFDVANTADHFVDWTNPPSDWLEAWTLLAAVARETSKVRLGVLVNQIPLRNPAMLARQALTLDHVSGGRLVVGLGIGLPIDPSYEMAGIPNWSNPERVARFGDYVAIVDKLLANEVSSHDGRFYRTAGAIMNPRPVQKPRPPLLIAAMAPLMLKRAAAYADIWNSLSFAETIDAQLEETRERVERLSEHCAAIGRDPQTLRRSYQLFDPGARRAGGAFNYYESDDLFVELVERVTALGISQIGLYYPMLEQQRPAFERLATDVIPKLRERYRSGIEVAA